MAKVMTRSGDGDLDATGVGTEANLGAVPCAADPSIGAPGPDALTQALELAREASARITTQFGTALVRTARLKVARAFERALLPVEKRPPGRKRKAAITAAYEDWKAGMRGLQLNLKHIPGYSGMGRYRREYARRRLDEAIRSRRRRERVQEPRPPGAGSLQAVGSHQGLSTDGQSPRAVRPTISPLDLTPAERP